MLNSLEIRNYRNLQHLKIDKLGRVNLIVGKNNTGKSSVLEAVSIYVAKYNTWAVRNLLLNRNEYDIDTYKQFNSDSEREKENFRLWSMIFPFHSEFGKTTIVIGEVKSDGLIIKLDKGDKWVIKLEHENFIERLQENKIPNYSSTRNLWSFSFENEGFAEISSECFQFVYSRNYENANNPELWGKVALSDSEKYVIEGLQIVEENIEKFSFIIEKGSPKAKVSLKNGSVVSLNSMGDGINRILTIILSMVNCENGYLLIDEFENGLHYSVQEKLWEIIFHLAERLNIQVFATTHSYDCIDAFSEVLNGGKHAKDSGIMIRLDNYEGTIEATVYEANEIQNTTRLHVDPR